MLDSRYQGLFEQAKKVTHYLDGFVVLKNQMDHFDKASKQTKSQPLFEVQLLHENESFHGGKMLKPSADNQEILTAIYYQIQQKFPEAGNAYWLSRTWSLLTWQPIYLSFLSIYGLKSLPEIEALTQVWRPELNFVAGFGLNGADFYSDSASALIGMAASQLQPLFESYRKQLNENIRIRPGYTNQLLADSLISCLLRFQLYLGLTTEQIPQHAKMWLDAFQLSTKPLDKIQLNSQTNQWDYVRTSCCMAYRCANGSLCSDCPKKK